VRNGGTIDSRAACKQRDGVIKQSEGRMKVRKCISLSMPLWLFHNTQN